MNNQIQGYDYMAVLGNPAAAIRPFLNEKVNRKQLERWTKRCISFQYILSKGRQCAQEQAFAVVIGTTIQPTSERATVTMPLTPIAIATTITEAEVLGELLSPGLFISGK